MSGTRPGATPPTEERPPHPAVDGSPAGPSTKAQTRDNTKVERTVAAPVMMCLENGAHRLLYTARKDAISPHQPFGPRGEGDLVTVEGYNASLHPGGLRWTQPRHSIPSPSRRYRWAALMNNFRERRGHRTVGMSNTVPPRFRRASRSFCCLQLSAHLSSCFG